MKVIRNALGMTALLALGLLVLAMSPRPARAEDSTSPPTPQALLKALAEAGKPGPEHQKLQPLVGEWAFTMKVWTDPSQTPAELKGVIERKWIMDGRFVQETLKGECCQTGKTFEGLGLLGYDRAQKKYTSVKACGLCGTIFNGLSTCDASGSRFECATEECCPLSGQKVKGRDELRIEGKDKIVLNAYKTINGRETKVIEIVSSRQK